VQLRTDRAVCRDDEGLVSSREEDLDAISFCIRALEDLERLTPTHIAGKMYFMRFLTSGMP
jgi:hypothetical protein